MEAGRRWVTAARGRRPRGTWDRVCGRCAVVPAALGAWPQLRSARLRVCRCSQSRPGGKRGRGLGEVGGAEPGGKPRSLPFPPPCSTLTRAWRAAEQAGAHSCWVSMEGRTQEGGATAGVGMGVGGDAMRPATRRMQEEMLEMERVAARTARQLSASLCTRRSRSIPAQGTCPGGRLGL